MVDSRLLGTHIFPQIPRDNLNKEAMLRMHDLWPDAEISQQVPIFHWKGVSWKQKLPFLSTLWILICWHLCSRYYTNFNIWHFIHPVRYDSGKGNCLPKSTQLNNGKKNPDTISHKIIWYYLAIPSKVI